MSVRVRFAPSPTGPLHIGGIRTALYNYLFARKNGGAFVLRIEDTDQARYVEGAEDYIKQGLEWSGIHPDEGPDIGGDYGPYRQSERGATYTEYAGKLLDSGHAYMAFDTPEELEAKRNEVLSAGQHAFRYDASTRMNMRNSLSLTTAETHDLLNKGTPYTLRLRVDPGELIAFDDIVRGKVVFRSDELDDKVLMKTDGLPTYHLANVIDDHLMQITHVIRGEEWLSSTAHHLLLYRAFGWETGMPQFAHIPLILKPAGKGKLSKRDGAKFGFPVFPLSWGDEFEGFREYGILPEAMINFLVFLGWNPGTDQEIFSLNELVDKFDLRKINKSGARFDIDKALWFNNHYIQSKDLSALAMEVLSRLDTPEGGLSSSELEEAIALYRDRAKTLNELAESIAVYTRPPGEYDGAFLNKKWSHDIANHMLAIVELLESVEPFSADSLQGPVKEYIERHNLKFGDIFQLLRTSITGSPKGPDLFAMMSILGKNAVVERIKQSISTFEQYT